MEEVFGENAVRLQKIIPEALTAAHIRARRGHDGAELATLEVYGHGLAVTQFEEVAKAIAALDGARMVKVHRYYLAVLDGWVFYPWRYADDSVSEIEKAQLRRPVSGLRTRLFRAHGPEPLQPALDESFELPTADDLHQAFPQLGEDTRLAVIPYACNVDSGVLNVAWGEAELHADGSLRWHRRPRPLPLPSREAVADTMDGGPVPVSDAPSSTARDGAHPRFDDAPLPATPVFPRMSSNPVSEPQPTEPMASDNDPDS